jgi:3-hydroxymyristoyl/3-hydroxydecanoyl-(acyl carrier protein) dehydratase
MSDSTTESVGIDAAMVLNRISVRPPYFALEDLTVQGEGMVTATVPVAPAPAPEVGAIEAAQVARHLAILGSCAAALGRDDDKRHHYLATKAHYTRLSNAPTEIDGPLRADAVASWNDRRTARALVKLATAGGQGLNLLDVEYTVLAPKMFDRFNPPMDADQLELAATAGDLSFETEVTTGGIRVECGVIPTSVCAGHFPDSPAAPVAIVMGKLCRAAAEAMLVRLGRPDAYYRIEEGHVVATKLGRAGQHLTLEASYLEPVRGGHKLKGVALADGDTIGEVTVTMSCHNAAPNGDSAAGELVDAESAR